jgi:hypothetical protein
MKLTRLNLCGAGARSVWLRNATSDVILKGEIDHFRNGMAGLTFSCGFSNMWKDPNNSSRIQHHVEFADVIKTRAYVVTGEYEGILTVIAYAHNHGNLVDMNDERFTATIMQNHPERLEQEFLFRAIIPAKRKITKPPIKKVNIGIRKPFNPRGALLRAMKAGLMSREEAEKRARQAQDQYELDRLMGRSRSK